MQQDRNKPSTPDRNQAPEYDAEAVRGGRIILRTRAQRIIFIAGLVGIVVLAFLIRIFAYG
ncbi:MAG TPA: hypothetical protein VIG90_11300 [Pedomonas sp.]|uniref:hypothetical protein n=1 Tax=Pedomonas sp. TaxID=2976421 RepID=UPI002F41CCD5